MTFPVADYVSEQTGGFWKVAGAAAPDEPTLAIVNVGDGDSVTATITGDAGVTNLLLYRKPGDALWTEGSTRSGDGSITQIGLDNNVRYTFVAVSQDAGFNSFPSPVRTVYVTDEDQAVLEDVIFHQMADNATGVLVATRIYRIGEVPQSTPEHDDPYVVYQRIDTVRERFQGGPHGLAHPRIQVSSYAPTPKEAKALADAVRQDWEVQSGPTGEAGATLTVKVASIEDERHFIETPEDASQRAMHRYDTDIIIWHLE